MSSGPTLFPCFWLGKLKTKYCFIGNSYPVSYKTFWRFERSVRDWLSPPRCDMSQHIPLWGTLPFHPRSSFLFPLFLCPFLSPVFASPHPVCLPFSLPVVSYGFQTLPPSSDHHLHFDACPGTAAPTTANTEPLRGACLSLLSFHLVIMNTSFKGCPRDYCFFPNLAQMSTKTQRILNLFVLLSYSFSNYDCEIIMFWKRSHSVPITQREKGDFDIKSINV